MRKYGWFVGLVMTFFGAFPEIQAFVQRIYSRGTTINSLALIVGGLILSWMIKQDIKSYRKIRVRKSAKFKAI